MEYTEHLPSSLPEHGAVLIEADLFNDAALLSWLPQWGFDAVTCWLMGSHRARALNEATLNTDPSEYRTIVHAFLHEIAPHILQREGLLSIVDRAVIPDHPDWLELVKPSLRQIYLEYAELTGMSVTDRIDVRPYTPPEGGIDMVFDDSPPPRDGMGYQAVLTHVRSRRSSRAPTGP